MEVAVPPIIDIRTSEAAQKRLRANNPKKTPPRIVNSPTLLTPLARCGCCGGPMRLRTGKGGSYRYYTCAKRADQGKAVCKGLSISMPKLDGIVLDALTDRILKPERLEAMLGQLLSRNVTAQERAQAELKALKRDKRELAKRLDNLYDAIETGGLDPNARLTDRIEKLQSEIDRIAALITAKERQLSAPHTAITPKKLALFAQGMRDRLAGGNPAFRKAYVRLFIDDVKVGREEIRITGPKHALLQAATEPLRPEQLPVRTFEREWRAGEDSNSRPPDS
ncbi:MAG: recombinase zinc beta ribbon domain-containing protein [Hyphomicrobiales bacterium]